MKWRDNVFFAAYGSAQIAHLVLFIVGQCMYPATTSVVLTLVCLAAVLGFSPLMLHSPADGEWTPVLRPCLCSMPWAVAIVTSYAIWAVCVILYYVLLLTAVADIALAYLVAYAASTMVVAGFAVAYAVLFYLHH